MQKSSSEPGADAVDQASRRWRAGQKKCTGEHVQERPVLQRPDHFLRDGRRRLGERVEPFRQHLRADRSRVDRQDSDVVRREFLAAATTAARSARMANSFWSAVQCVHAASEQSWLSISVVAHA